VWYNEALHLASYQAVGRNALCVCQDNRPVDMRKVQTVLHTSRRREEKRDGKERKGKEMRRRVVEQVNQLERRERSIMPRDTGPFYNVCSKND